VRRRPASLRETARLVGSSPATVMRDERRALDKLRRLWGGGPPPERVSPGLLMVAIELEVTRHEAFTAYCRRLMVCRPGEVPDDEPPEAR